MDPAPTIATARARQIGEIIKADMHPSAVTDAKKTRLSISVNFILPHSLVKKGHGEQGHHSQW